MKKPVGYPSDTWAVLSKVFARGDHNRYLVSSKNQQSSSRKKSVASGILGEFSGWGFSLWLEFNVKVRFC